MDEDCFVTKTRKNYFKKHGYSVEKFQSTEEDYLTIEHALNDLFELAVKQLSPRFSILRYNTSMDRATEGLNEFGCYMGDFTGGKTAERFVDFLEECLYNIIEELKDERIRERCKKLGKNSGFDTLNEFHRYAY